ncbi:Mrp/NBP35 family ATP-binding protein [Sphingomonas piscis]|uniref:Iron-sulfur cluster carrier protein n=1 Tax=Sphingomonas piscis TaxID=2714943 RepID=A0A6G7YQY3_9SPHN|nr:Mrp/NBP35 family ATP-binding protein [Sphingomonas piscis]QIK79146.1 Mrp/NBP35 family ATP-binding protein [Sphingomonas piscis]
MADTAAPLAELDKVADAGRIRSRKLDGGIATLVVDVTGLGDQDRSALERSLRSAALGIAGVSEVRIALTAAQQSRTIVAVGSGKGGVGKSTLTTNLAIALARAGKRVGVIDADIYGPSQPTLLGSEEKPRAENDRLIPVAAHGIRFLSLGQLVGAGQALAWRGPMATGALSRLIEADWGDCEIILVDLPPGTGDVQLTLLQKARPAGAVVVSTPQDLSLIDARRAIDLFGKLNVPVLGLVENMASYVCPHCGESSDPFGTGSVEREAAAIGVPFLGRLPLSRAIRAASDEGVPPASGTGSESDAFAELAGKLLTALDTAAA